MVRNRWGQVAGIEGRVAGIEVVHVCRHGPAHVRLSNQVNHRANLRALLDAEVDAVIATTACGALDPGLEPGSLVVFDDLYFPSNRLPDGSLCTWHVSAGEAGRGHWMFEQPFSEGLRQTLIDAAVTLGVSARFNTRAEIAALARLGVTAISQTLGPEVVLAGEAELPIAAVGYVTDYANGVGPEPEPAEDAHRSLGWTLVQTYRVGIRLTENQELEEPAVQAHQVVPIRKRGAA